MDQNQIFNIKRSQLAILKSHSLSLDSNVSSAKAKLASIDDSITKIKLNSDKFSVQLHSFVHPLSRDYSATVDKIKLKADQTSVQLLANHQESLQLFEDCAAIENPEDEQMADMSLLIDLEIKTLKQRYSDAKSRVESFKREISGKKEFVDQNGWEN